jgi:hypothetical protein
MRTSYVTRKKNMIPRMPEPKLITCPECEAKFPMDEFLTSQISGDLKREMEQDFKEKEKDIKERIREEIHERHSLETKDLNERLGEQKEKITKLESAELDKRRAERQLNEFKKKYDQEVEREAEKIQGKTKDEFDKKLKKVQERYNFEKEKELAVKQSEFTELTNQLRAAKNKSLEWENKILEEKNKVKEKNLELAKEFELKKENWRNEVKQQAQNEQQLKLDEHKKKIDDLTKTIGDLKSKAEQGSQQTQGEVLEKNLKAVLEENFREDIIEDVPKGVTGADLIQKIISSNGDTCGVLLWECKNTASWNPGWIDKLKSDLKDINGNIPILVSKTLPKEIITFGEVKNVWVARMDLVVPLAQILRKAVMDLYQKDMSLEGTEMRTRRLYTFLTSSKFKNIVHDTIEVYSQQIDLLEKEQITTKKRWKKQKLLIERVQENIVNMYGSFEAIIGGSLAELEDISGDHLLNANE